MFNIKIRYFSACSENFQRSFDYFWQYITYKYYIVKTLHRMFQDFSLGVLEKGKYTEGWFDKRVELRVFIDSVFSYYFDTTFKISWNKLYELFLLFPRRNKFCINFMIF